MDTTCRIGRNEMRFTRKGPSSYEHKDGTPYPQR